MVDGRGEVYLGTLRLDCFSRVAAGNLGAVADVSCTMKDYTPEGLSCS